MSAESADWCVGSEALSISGTRMMEARRKAWGNKWCFHCRTRHEFDWVLYTPDGPSYYGPYVEIEGPRRGCTDLFPGWTREWEEP